MQPVKSAMKSGGLTLSAVNSSVAETAAGLEVSPSFSFSGTVDHERRGSKHMLRGQHWLFFFVMEPAMKSMKSAMNSGGLTLSAVYIVVLFNFKTLLHF